jgi:Xaa-Pro dipeptidase
MFDDLTQMRQVKSPAELACVRRAAEMVTEAMKAGIEAVHEGALESDVALEVQRILALRGSEYVASPVFISSSPLPHATAMPDKLNRGAIISIEFGASYKRYHATNTRAVCVGEANPEVRRVSEACLEAFDAAGNEIRPGAAFQNVDRAARRVFQKYNLLPYFRHRIAYTIGIGFSPTWGPRVGGDCNYLNMTSASTTQLKEGMVFHLLPLVFIPKMGAMGFSETIVVTKTGWEALTTVRRELMVR